MYMTKYKNIIQYTFIACVCMCIYGTGVSAENMTGNTYTLRASVSTIGNESQSSTYSLKSSGGAVGVENATGGVYVLHPTIFSTYVQPVSSNNQVSVQVEGITFGGESGVAFIPATLLRNHISVPVFTEESYINSSTTPIYTDHASDTVYSNNTSTRMDGFGTKTIPQKHTTTAETLKIYWWIWIVCIVLASIHILQTKDNKKP